MRWWSKSKRAQSSEDYETWTGGGVTPTLNAFDNGDSRAVTVVAGSTAAVRRLTPMECERLQGFPDGWTEHRIDPKKGLIKQADSPRYKQMGNAVAVPCVEWIINRLVGVDRD